MQTTLTLPAPRAARRAVFSPCRRFRYSLEIDLVEADVLDALGRAADASGLEADGPRRIVWLMLNPSIADETRDDPTVARCVKRSRSWGYHVLEVVNVYALVSTDPRGLKIGDDLAVGPDNDRAILRACLAARSIVCAWGRHASADRVEQLADLLTPHVAVSALQVNKDGSPAHPLYLPDALIPVSFGLRECADRKRGRPPFTYRGLRRGEGG